MKIAITIGSYRLIDFVRLNLLQCKKVFPDATILVSDDASERSESIAKLATDLGATYIGSNSRRGHFSGDFSAIINCIQFAKAHEADLAIKVSQRFIFKNPLAAKALLDPFEGNMEKCFGLPGRIGMNTIRPGGTMGFTKLPVQTDLLVFRTDQVQPEVILEDYRKKCANAQYQPHGTFIEGLCADLADSRWKDRTIILNDFTEHVNGRTGGDYFLRRNQNHKRDYLELAKENGLTGDFELAEWQQMEGHKYWPYPRAL